MRTPYARFLQASFARRTLPYDKHSGHTGKNLDGVLGQMVPPVTRERILGKCTAELAAADQSTDNQKLKRLTCEVFRELRLDECLKAEAIEFGQLTLAV